MSSQPVRNLQIISSPGVGGREIDVPVLAKKLIEQGHPTWVMCRPGTLVEKLSQQWSLPIVPTLMNWYFNPKEIVKIAGFLRKKRIQVIHAHWSKDLSNIILAAKLAGAIPVVLTKHVYATESKKDVFHDWVYRHTDLVIAISDLVAENVFQTVKIDRNKIITIYNGIDLNQYWNPALNSVRDLRQEFGVPSQQPILGYVGRLNQGKQPHLIIEAFIQLAHTFPNWHLVLVGKAVGEKEEQYARQLVDQVKQAKLDDRIHFTGYRTDMPSVMHTFTIFACASKFESLGMVMVEAMAMERPALGPNSGGVPEIIETEKNGLLYEAGNVNDLVRKMEILMAHDDRCQMMGKVGRKSVLEKFNLELMAQEVVAAFRTVLKKVHAD